MDRAHDVARRCRGRCSMIACRCRQMFDSSSTPPRVAHQHLRVVAPGERVIVAGIRHHQLVPDIAGPAREQKLLLGVEIAGSQYQETGSCDVALRAESSAVARFDIGLPFLAFR